ncbi:MAG: GAF domain-containing protein [Candidatus Omnitrophica bacterium]|nr:GAF domain-containing protein [Candidatus Omnitrophota bacterium]
MGEQKTKQHQPEQRTVTQGRPPTRWPWDVKENRFSALTRVNQSLAVASERDSALERILEATLALLRARRGSILLVDPQMKNLTVKISKGMPPSVSAQISLKLGEGISGFVAEKGRPLLVQDIQTYRSFRKTPASRYESESFFSIPIVSAPLNIWGQTIGVMNISDTQYGASFTTEDLALLSVLATEAALVALYWKPETGERLLHEAAAQIQMALTSINGHAQYLALQIPQECKSAEVLKKIIQQSQDAMTVLKQLQKERNP